MPHLIKNFNTLVQEGTTIKDKNARRLVLEFLEKAINEADPTKIIKKNVDLEDNTLRLASSTFNLKKLNRILVIGGGKASGRMAEALEEILGDVINGGVVNILRGTAHLFKTKNISLYEADHPLPDKKGVEGVRSMLNLVKGLNRDDLVICLISGGASSLMPQPRSPLTLEGLREITNILLRAGADIHELNSVRKHLSIIKGGQLARYLQPARVVSLILSDVVGDDLDVIASGLTVPDRSTFKDAEYVLKKYNLWEKVPEEARSILKLGLNGTITDNPRIGDPIFKTVSNHVIGSNHLICEKTAKIFRDRGLNVRHLTSYLEGESREVGNVIASIIREMCYRREKYSIIMGGETTVKVKGDGKGGRNMETVLAVATKIKGLNGVAMASVGTDGIDGPTDAAGAICDGSTYYKSQLLNLKAKDFLVKNNSYSFFKKVGGLIKTNPTGTNVNDIVFFTVI